MNIQGSHVAYLGDLDSRVQPRYHLRGDAIHLCADARRPGGRHVRGEGEGGRISVDLVFSRKICNQ